ncbi:MAG TPA: metalloregulator ArsR/SmtB family transcription factor [Candidatus Methylacidiphilales bacterium]|nr:metalloregulator ArsR/SmtB family transcription factor [Candidatus Methylacidiphilales bacterium]
MVRLDTQTQDDTFNFKVKYRPSTAHAARRNLLPVTLMITPDQHSDTDKLSPVFAALADPTRRAILARLSAGEATVTELAEPFDMSLPAISKHLKVLERSGLIARGRDAQWRPCRLNAEPMREISDWIDHFRRHWEDSFDRLDEYLKTLQAQPPQSSEPPQDPPII